MMRPSARLRRDLEHVGQALSLDDQRMIARHLNALGQALEHALAGVADGRQLAVHGLGRADHLAAVDLADGLVAEADAEQRDLAAPALAMRSRQMPASLGVHGPGDSTMAFGPLNDVGGADLVVADDLARSTQLTQVVDEIVGEAVIVIDEDEHALGLGSRHRRVKVEKPSRPRCWFPLRAARS